MPNPLLLSALGRSCMTCQNIFLTANTMLVAEQEYDESVRMSVLELYKVFYATLQGEIV